MNIKEQVNDWIKEAKFLEVSDIHFHPKEENVSIYYRMLGKLIYQKDISIENYNKILRYLKFITRLDISVNKKPQDGSFFIKDKSNKIFVRIATIPLLNSESLVIRILTDQNSLNLNNISFFENDIKEMTNTILEQTGLFIFTGPTGSGKTTTIYSIMDYIATKHSKKIITLENPVEIINKNLMQVGIDEKLNIDYSSSLKAILRQDPDIIMIGEIRDEDTARNVFRAALTGHTVVSTMHTRDIYGVVERFIDFGFLLSEIESVLIGVSNQRLFLNAKGVVKSVYNYEIGESLAKVIRKEKESKSINQKIIEAKKVVEYDKSVDVKENENSNNDLYETTRVKDGANSLHQHINRYNQKNAKKFKNIRNNKASIKQSSTSENISRSNAKSKREFSKYKTRKPKNNFKKY